MAVTIPNLQALLASLNGNKPGAAANLTPASDLGKAAPMQAFQALAPTILGNEAQFARPEAARLLASLTGAQTPRWAMTPQEIAAANAPRPAPAPMPPAPTPTPKPPTPTSPYITTPFGNFGNIQALIQQYLAGKTKTPTPTTPPKATTAIAPGTSGPAPSARAATTKSALRTWMTDDRMILVIEVQPRIPSASTTLATSL